MGRGGLMRRSGSSIEGVRQQVKQCHALCESANLIDQERHAQCSVLVFGLE